MPQLGGGALGALGGLGGGLDLFGGPSAAAAPAILYSGWYIAVFAPPEIVLEGDDNICMDYVRFLHIKKSAVRD